MLLTGVAAGTAETWCVMRVKHPSVLVFDPQSGERRSADERAGRSMRACGGGGTRGG